MGCSAVYRMICPSMRTDGSAHGQQSEVGNLDVQAVL